MCPEAFVPNQTRFQCQKLNGQRYSLVPPFRIVRTAQQITRNSHFPEFEEERGSKAVDR